MATAGRFKNMRIRSGVNFFSAQNNNFGWRLLIFFVLLTYVPFLGNRVVRPAGDDKVYVSQAIEMAAQGNWFLQSLGNEPNYYKGPFHYILLRAGMIVFGDSMWATVYMNLILVILGAVALGALVQRNMREFEGWAFWVASAFALNAGIYAHMFASQMEVETAALFAIGLYFLDRSGPGRADLKFWLIAGIAGWIKSPLHSVLLGTTALLFWGWERTLFPRMLSWRAWAAAIAGIALCAVGYLPAFLLDHDTFMATYIFRETLDKPSNGAAWHYPITPFFTYSLLPWTLPAFVAYADGLSRIWRRQRAIRSTPGSKRVVALGVALMVPSILFFLIHPYRGQNYNIPVMGGLVLAVGAIWATRARNWSKYYSLALALTAMLVVALPAGLTYFGRRFDPLPYWWPSWLLPLLWVGALVTARGFWREGVTFNMVRPASLARRSVWLFVVLGFLLTTIGEREMIDIRNRISTDKNHGETPHFAYYNLQKNIWSEWGYLNFMIPYPVRGLFTPDDLKAAVVNRETILVPGDEWLEIMKKEVRAEFPGAEWRIATWKRWMTKGKNAAGETNWKQAWNARSLSKVERNFYMVDIVPSAAAAPRNSER
jgi:4-amino-4-deoxy-L-arabinose transferase-like glycosyltransferase